MAAAQKNEDLEELLVFRWPTWSRAFIRYINICRRRVDGDLDRLLILADLGVRVHRLHTFRSASHMTGRIVAKELDPLDAAANATEISQSTGIPRETVRRKIVWMAKRNWLDKAPNSSFAISKRAGVELSGTTAELFVPAEEMILAAQNQRASPTTTLEFRQPRSLLKMHHGEIWPAWADHTLSVLGLARKNFGHDLDKVMILLTLGQIALERLGIDSILTRSSSPSISSLSKGRSNRLSLGASLSIPRETARRKIENLIRSGSVRTAPSKTIHISEAGLALYRDFVRDAATEISVFQGSLQAIVDRIART